MKTLRDWVDDLDRIRRFSHVAPPEVAEAQERMIKYKMRQLFTPEQLREYNVFFEDDF